MLQWVEQHSSKDRLWVSEFRPQVAGLEVSWAEWTLWVRGEPYTVPADRFTLEAGAQDQLVRLWLSPREEDGYLHVDVVLEDGAHDSATPDPWPPIGAELVLWGNLTAGASEPDLYVLKHVEAERAV